jgi:hypothetical protein
VALIIAPHIAVSPNPALHPGPAEKVNIQRTNDVPAENRR